PQRKHSPVPFAMPSASAGGVVARAAGKNTARRPQGQVPPNRASPATRGGFYPCCGKAVPDTRHALAHRSCWRRAQDREGLLIQTRERAPLRSGSDRPLFPPPVCSPRRPCGTEFAPDCVAFTEDSTAAGDSLKPVAIQEPPSHEWPPVPLRPAPFS